MTEAGNKHRWNIVLFAILGGALNALADELLINKDFNWASSEGISHLFEVFVIGAVVTAAAYFKAVMKPALK